MPRPVFVWTDDHGTGRNVFALFRKRFKLASVPRAAVLHLFADTRYRLRVNGEVASYGPARFTPTAPEHDSVDLAPLLVKGWNVVTVEANHKGASSFDSLPSSGGFIAWGKAGAIDLSTPGDWKAVRATAWDEQAPVFSFAQGPIEMLDVAKLPRGWLDRAADDRAWPKVTVLARQDAWGRMRPRSIPALSLDERVPARVLLVAPLRDDEERIGYREDGAASSHGARRRTPYAMHVHSPHDQEVTLGLFWGPHFLNGHELHPTTSQSLGNRQDIVVRLRAGWNFLYGEPEVMTSGWLVVIGLPRGKGLTAAAEPSLEARATMLHGDSLPEAELAGLRGGRVPTSIAELPRLPMAWREVARGAVLDVPARAMAWDRPAEAAAHDANVVQDLVLPTAGGRDATAVFDLGGEYLGHAVVELAAPAGTIVDIAYSERLREDGMLALFQTHWMVSEAERFIAAGSRSGSPERFEGYHARGGRYLQVTVRGATSAVTLARVAVRDTTYPLRVEGRFASSDPLFDWVWGAGVATLRACMEDAYLDCPWRERGLYLGDALVEYHVTRAVTSDAAMVRRCLWLWAAAQLPNGQFQDVVPSWHDTVLEDYSLIWVILLHDYWSATGDAKLVKELWRALEPLFASPSWVFAESGLINADAMHCFIDWGENAESKKGECATLNMYWCRALECAAVLAGVIGKRGEASSYAKRAKLARAKLVKGLWVASDRRFAATRAGGQLLAGPAIHANTLALYFDLVPNGHVDAVIGHIEAVIEDNPKQGPVKLGPYFFHFLLGGLYAHGREAAAERAVRRNYGLMSASGAWTMWENFTDHASRCHAWSATPLHYFSERVLGVRQERPGSIERMVVAPQASSLRWASGVVPHARGPIAVSWRRHGEVLEVGVDAPKGVRISVRPAGELAALRLRLVGKAAH